MDLEKQEIDLEKIMKAHIFLKRFVSIFDEAKRGGIHDFLELTVANMVNDAITKMDAYLESSHTLLDGRELMIISLDAFQKVLDGVKRNLDKMKSVGMN